MDYVFLIDLLSFGKGGFHLKLDVQGQEGGRIMDVDGQVGWGRGGPENWTIFMDAICVSSLKGCVSIFNKRVYSTEASYCQNSDIQ